MAVATSRPSQWSVGERDRLAEERLQRELGIPSIVAGVLVRRGLTDPAAADKFLKPDLADLHPPKKLPDFEAARDAILGARERNELIFVHGDYDVDGVTSAALLNRFLTRIGCTVHTHVPHRMREGYGVNISAVEAARELGARLFLTCDCGTHAHEQIRRAREYGMRVVVTDHHAVDDDLPEPDALVNPHRTDSEYPFPEISGVGVAFKLCMGLTEELGHERAAYCRAFLDLTALGTIADVMPLRDENRIIAKFGLERLTETKKPGLRALIDVCNFDLKESQWLTTYHVSFQLGPRINAAGRIDDAAVSLQLLLENDEQRAAQLAREVDQLNRNRREEQDRTIQEAIDLVNNNGWGDRHVILVAQEGWHPGVVGIVAGKLVEQFHRPCFVCTIDREKGVCKGSARSIPGFHLASAIWEHPELMTGGGHAMAAGCSFPADSLSQVADALNRYGEARLSPEDLIRRQSVDFEVEPGEITMAAAEALEWLQPFGFGNPQPCFVARNMSVAQIMPTKNPLHARLTLRGPAGGAVPGIGFGLGPRFAESGAGAQADILFAPKVDEWRGNVQLKWEVKDFNCLEVGQAALPIT